MATISSVAWRLYHTVKTGLMLDQHIDELKIENGILLSRSNQSVRSELIRDYEFKVFSQWGEDGILQYLTTRIPIKDKTFVEFGVEDFRESNCRFLMMKDNWSGMVIDGSPKNIKKIRSSHYFWRHQLTAECTFITRDNINAVLASSGIGSDCGILSVDIDGNDYHVLESIVALTPRILVVEYNSVFGPSREITVPYAANFTRTSAHSSNLYFGASLGALAFIGAKKGYRLLGTGSSGVNAFFARADVIPADMRTYSVEEAFTASQCRESRDTRGVNTFVGGAARAEVIRGLPVLNVRTQQVEAF